MNTIDTTIKEIITKIHWGLENIYGDELDQIILFGSPGRNETISHSDIDVLIVLKNQFNYFQESLRISIFIVDICLEYTVMISCTFATV